MITFNDISVKYKILAIALVSVIGFIVYLAVNMINAKENDHRLKSIEKIYFPLLEGADLNLVRLDKIKDTFNFAVSSGEEDLIMKSDKLRDDIRQSLDNMSKLDPVYLDYFASLHRSLDDYYNAARSLSIDMIKGTFDFSTSQNRIKEMQDLLEGTISAYTGFRASMYSQFTITLDEANASAHNALYIGLGTGAIVIALMLATALFVARRIVSNLRTVCLSLHDMASGEADLSLRLPQTSKDELGSLVGGLNLFIQRLQEIMKHVKDVSQKLGVSSSDMRVMADRLDDSVEKQQSETAQVATAVTEMATTISQVAQHATEASETACAANEQTQTGKVIVDATVKSMNTLATEVDRVADVVHRLADESKKIEHVLDVIQGISGQTNLLALNAAIEAARAGEQGRGFAVVADEVRVLAGRTHDATREIQIMIEQLQKGTSEAVSAMESGRQTTRDTAAKAAQANDSLTMIAEAIVRINEMNTQIASATEQQSAVAQEIDRKTTRISDLADSTRLGTKEATKSGETLSYLANELQELVGKYKV